MRLTEPIVVRLLTALFAGAGLLALASCGAEAPTFDPGTISVTSTPPGAVILLDGTATGSVTPATLADVAAGVHEVSVALADFVSEPTSVPVDVKPLGTYPVDFQLSQTGFTIESPAGAAILVGGVATGKTVPATVGGLDAGTVSVSLEYEGFLIIPDVFDVDIVEGTITSIPDTTFQTRALKTVWLDGFANTSCIPCPELTANLLAMTAQTEFSPDRVQFMEFAVSWPQLTDPFFLANAQENSDRFNYYNVLGAPDLYVDGVKLADPLDYDAMEAAVRAAMGEDPGFLIEVSADFETLNIPVEVTLTALRDVDLAGYELYVAYYETEVVIEPAPGLNNQTHFHHVFRDRVDVLTDLGPLTTGTPQTFNLNFGSTSTVTPNYVSVAFVQHKTTHAILQAGYAVQPAPVQGKETR